MGTVTITPASFVLVLFDAPTLRDVVADVARRCGVDSDIAVDVAEESPLARARVASYDPVRLWLEGGAIEDTKRPRHLAVPRAHDVIGRLLLRVRDRRSGRFDGAPPDDDLTLAQMAAWDVHSIGRLARAGLAVQQARWLYQFRNRHGFTDAADRAFATLWAAGDLDWTTIDLLSREAHGAGVAG